MWIHNDLTQVSGYTPEKMRRFFNYDKVMVISEKIQDTFLSLAGNEDEKHKIVRIYNPLDTEEILTKAENRSLIMNLIHQSRLLFPLEPFFLRKVLTGY
jgi:hypothetical protein